MKQPRIYVAVSLTHHRNKKCAKLICDFLMRNGAEVTSLWVAEDDAKQGLMANQVYKRDVDAVKASDAMVADVSNPSLGVGMEIMLAESQNIPIVCLHEEYASVSWMVVGCPCIKLISYSQDRIDEALKKTAIFLGLST